MFHLDETRHQSLTLELIRLFHLPLFLLFGHLCKNRKKQVGLGCLFYSIQTRCTQFMH